MKLGDHGTQPITQQETTKTILPTLVPTEVGPATESDVPGQYGPLENKIRPPPMISGHLANVIQSITHAPCVPSEDKQISVEPVLSVGGNTTQPPTIPGIPTIGRGELGPMTLPAPVRGGTIPASLLERMATTEKIKLPDIVVKPTKVSALPAISPSPTIPLITNPRGGVPQPTLTLPSRATIPSFHKTS